MDKKIDVIGLRNIFEGQLSEYITLKKNFGQAENFMHYLAYPHEEQYIIHSIWVDELIEDAEVELCEAVDWLLMNQVPGQWIQDNGVLRLWTAEDADKREKYFNMLLNYVKEPV